MGAEVGEQIAVGERANRSRRVESSLGHGLDLAQTGLFTDGPRARQAQLDAVVAGGVVRRREHRTRRIERAGCVVDQVG
jgi:hypothetical protein